MRTRNSSWRALIGRSPFTNCSRQLMKNFSSLYSRLPTFFGSFHSRTSPRSERTRSNFARPGGGTGFGNDFRNSQ